MTEIAPLDQTSLTGPTPPATSTAPRPPATPPVSYPDDLDPGIIPSPLKDPHAWSSVTIAGVTIGPKDGSGLVKIVDNAGRPYKWQIKDASGQDGGRSTYRGKRPPEFGLQFHLWTDAHFAAYQNLVTTSFLYDTTKTAVDAVDIYHPGLALVGLTQILVDHVGIPEQQGERKYWHALVKVHEYFPPAAVNTTQSPTASTNGQGGGAAGGGAAGDPPDPNADWQKAIAEQKALNVQAGVASPEGSGLP